MVLTVKMVVVEVVVDVVGTVVGAWVAWHGTDKNTNPATHSQCALALSLRECELSQPEDPGARLQQAIIAVL